MYSSFSDNKMPSFNSSVSSLDNLELRYFMLEKQKIKPKPKLVYSTRSPVALEDEKNKRPAK